MNLLLIEDSGGKRVEERRQTDSNKTGVSLSFLRQKLHLCSVIDQTWSNQDERSSGNLRQPPAFPFSSSSTSLLGLEASMGHGAAFERPSALFSSSGVLDVLCFEMKSTQFDQCRLKFISDLESFPMVSRCM